MELLFAIVPGLFEQTLLSISIRQVLLGFASASISAEVQGLATKDAIMSSELSGAITILSQFKEITHRIVNWCEQRQRPCSERVAAYTLRAVTLDSNSEFDFEMPLPLKQLQRLVELAGQRVLATDNPAIETIKMQAAFDGVSVYADQLIRKSNLLHEEETNKQIEHIVEFAARLKSDVQITNMYKLVFDVLVLNAAVERVDRNVEREIAAALQSAFPKSRIKAFAQMSAAQKREQIGGLINIVLGIRLFNRSIGKGGAALKDTPAALSSAINSLLAELEDEISAVTKVSEQYADVIRIEFAFPGTINASLPRLQDELRNRQQYFSFLSHLHTEVSEAKALIENALTHFSTEMESLGSLVGSRVSVPKGQVFPKFDALGRLWRALDAELQRCNAKRTVFTELLKFKQNYECNLTQEDIDLLHDSELSQRVSEKEAQDAHIRSNDAESPMARVSGGNCILLKPEDVENFSEIELEYEGYCPWTIVNRDALLLPGDISLGVVHYRNKYYALVDSAAVKTFMNSPSKYIEGVEAKVRGAPELIRLLHLQSQFPDVHGFDESNKSQVSSYGEVSNTAEASTETPVHFEPDETAAKSYIWNEWELRRRALQLVRLRRTKTHHTQTHNSHFRRDAETQCTEKTEQANDKATQSGLHKETNTVVRRRYIQGLRGHPQSKVKVLTLEL